MLYDNVFFKHGQRFVFLDTETESLNLVNARPFEVSWIVADRKDTISQNDLYVYFKDLNMSADAAKITKFDSLKYKISSISPEDVYKKLSIDLFDPQNIIVGQNILNFDCYIIKNLQRITGNKVDYSYLKRTIDTKCLFIALQKGIKYNPETPFLDWQYKVGSIAEKGLKSSQQTMLTYFDIPHDKDKLHNALYDIQMLSEIFKNLLQRIEVPDLTK